jgi:hypothetical protein
MRSATRVANDESSRGHGVERRTTSSDAGVVGGPGLLWPGFERSRQRARVSRRRSVHHCSRCADSCGNTLWTSAHTTVEAINSAASHHGALVNATSRVLEKPTAPDAMVTPEGRAPVLLIEDAIARERLHRATPRASGPDRIWARSTRCASLPRPAFHHLTRSEQRGAFDGSSPQGPSKMSLSLISMPVRGGTFPTASGLPGRTPKT